MSEDKEIQDFDRIEKFLEGKLSHEDARRFEAAMNEDEAFRSTVEELGILFDGIQYTGRRAMVAKMAVWDSEQDIEKEREPKLFLLKPWYKKYGFMGIAASLALLMGFFIFFYNQTPSSEELIGEYYERLFIPGVTTRGENTNRTIKAKAQIAYNNEDFEAAIVGFETLDPSMVSNEDRVYMGLAHFELDHFDEAIRYFDMIPKDETINYGRAQWYKGLTQLKAERFDDARYTFTQLMESDSSYRAKAIAILEEF